MPNIRTQLLNKFKKENDPDPIHAWQAGFRSAWLFQGLKIAVLTTFIDGKITKKTLNDYLEYIQDIQRGTIPDDRNLDGSL